MGLTFVCTYLSIVFKNDNVKINVKGQNDLGKKKRLASYENRNESVIRLFAVHEHPHIEKLSKCT